ncbi:MAG: RepB family plasmid replication initiator protein [Erysipelotrichia bacterium]|nr:RepB family plasmid replication initiator protein [Erysipelotrichia bacterium]
MIINQIINKNNILTDSNLPDSAVLTQKLVNVLYSNYEKQGAEFTIHIKDLCKQLDITNQSRNHSRIKDSLKILKQPIELRNFNDKKGRKLKWYLGSFLDKAKIFEDTMEYVDVKIDEDLIEGMKQHKHYTKIDLEISNKFKTKYGIVIWEMYLRYKNAIREETPIDLTYQMFSLDELNSKFSTKYKYISEMERSLKRGLKEIEEITGIKIAVKWQKNFDKFGFFWKREKETQKFMTDELAFIKYIRTQYFNEFLLEIDNYKTKKYTGKIALKCTEEGYLVDMFENVKFGKAEAKQLWNYLFTHQNQIMALKQARFDF